MAKRATGSAGIVASGDTLDVSAQNYLKIKAIWQHSRVKARVSTRGTKVIKAIKVEKDTDREVKEGKAKQIRGTRD